MDTGLNGPIGMPDGHGLVACRPAATSDGADRSDERLVLRLDLRRQILEWHHRRVLFAFGEHPRDPRVVYVPSRCVHTSDQRHGGVKVEQEVRVARRQAIHIDFPANGSCDVAKVGHPATDLKMANA